MRNVHAHDFSKLLFLEEMRPQVRGRLMCRCQSQQHCRNVSGCRCLIMTKVSCRSELIAERPTMIDGRFSKFAPQDAGCVLARRESDEQR
jgi:hypothetical protein